MMTSLTTGTRYPVVTLFLALWVALLALAMQASDVGATALEDHYTGHKILCQALGGTVDGEGTHEHRTHADGRVGAVVKCNGSIIGGYECQLFGENSTFSYCSQTRTAVGEDIHVAPVGGIEDISDPDIGGPGGIGGITVQPGSAEDPTGDAEELIERQVSRDDQVGACEALGGTASLIDQTTRPVICTGGILDGMDGTICYGTICDYFSGSAGSEEDPSVAPTGGMLVVSVAPGDGLGDTTGASVTPGATEDPTGGETMVIMNQSGRTVDETTKGQAAFCQGLLGTATIIDSGPGLSIVSCKGGLFGLLDGMTCFNSENATNCMFVSLVLPEDPQVTPAAGVEAPAADAPTATAAATEAQPTPTATVTAPPPMPTMAPTDVPAEPTVAPPSDPPPPRNDNSVPPGESVEPGKPTPTPVVLT